MLTVAQIEYIKELVGDSLDQAEGIWNKNSKVFRHAMEDMALGSTEEVVPSSIPGHEFVSSGKPKAEDFIAIMLDMRNSSEHLMQAISSKTAKVSQFQRVYYETTALLPAMAQTLKFGSGKVTEYLGDGLLALFRVADFPDLHSAIRAANVSTKNCVEQTLVVVNDALAARYSLPPLVIGVGMALSPALVLLVGLEGERQARVLGECVYRASKLSGGDNEIVVDDKMKEFWPRSRGGRLKFVPKKMKGVEGHKIIR